MPARVDRALSPLVLVVAGLLIELVWIGISRNADPDRLNGINGLVGGGIPVLIALRSVLAGTVVALAGSMLFVALVAYEEPPDPVGYGALVVVTWTGLALVVGLTARALRTRARTATEEALELHREVLSTLVPRPAVRRADVRVRVAFEPGEARLEFGGDFFDVVETADHGVAAVIGDVSGHGPHAAALGAELRAAWRGMIAAGLTPPQRLAALREVLALSAPDGETFATLCSCVIDPDMRRATIACAGHPPPLLLLAGEAAPVVASAGPPLSPVIPGRWDFTSLTLPDPFGLLFYTDGLVEGRADSGVQRRYGIEGALQSIARIGSDDGGLIEGLIEDAVAAHGARLPDDVAIVLIAHGSVRR